MPLARSTDHFYPALSWLLQKDAGLMQYYTKNFFVGEMDWTYSVRDNDERTRHGAHADSVLYTAPRKEETTPQCSTASSRLSRTQARWFGVSLATVRQSWRLANVGPPLIMLLVLRWTML